MKEFKRRENSKPKPCNYISEFSAVGKDGNMWHAEWGKGEEGRLRILLCSHVLGQEVVMSGTNGSQYPVHLRRVLGNCYGSPWKCIKLRLPQT